MYVQNISEDKNIVRSLIALAIEHTLLKLGPGELEMVIEKLEEDYSSYLFDSYDHPEYLKSTLQYLYVNDYNKVIGSIKKELGVLSIQKPYEEFLKIMQKSLINNTIN